MPYMGYHYTFVVKKFYFNSYIDAGMGYDYTYIKNYNDEGLNNRYVENVASQDMRCRGNIFSLTLMTPYATLHAKRNFKKE